MINSGNILTDIRRNPLLNLNKKNYYCFLENFDVKGTELNTNGLYVKLCSGILEMLKERFSRILVAVKTE